MYMPSGVYDRRKKKKTAEVLDTSEATEEEAPTVEPEISLAAVIAEYGKAKQMLDMTLEEFKDYQYKTIELEISRPATTKTMDTEHVRHVLDEMSSMLAHLATKYGQMSADLLQLQSRPEA